MYNGIGGSSLMLLCTAGFHRRLQTSSAAILCPQNEALSPAILPTSPTQASCHSSHFNQIPYSRPAILDPFNSILLEKQAIARVLWNLKFNNHVPIMSQMNPIHILPTTHRFPKPSVSFRFCNENFV